MYWEWHSIYVWLPGEILQNFFKSHTGTFLQVFFLFVDFCSVVCIGLGHLGCLREVQITVRGTFSSISIVVGWQNATLHVRGVVWYVIIALGKANNCKSEKLVNVRLIYSVPNGLGYSGRQFGCELVKPTKVQEWLWWVRQNGTSEMKCLTLHLCHLLCGKRFNWHCCLHLTALGQSIHYHWFITMLIALGLGLLVSFSWF